MSTRLSRAATRRATSRRCSSGRRSRSRPQRSWRSWATTRRVCAAPLPRRPGPSPPAPTSTGSPCASGSTWNCGYAGASRPRPLARRVVHFEELPHLGQPPALHEPDVIRVAVVLLIGGAIGELHRDPEAVVVLRADLGQELERLDAGD